MVSLRQVRCRPGLTERRGTLEDRPIATAHMSPGETKNEEGGFLLFRGGLLCLSHERNECPARRPQAVQVACSCRRRSRYLAKTARSFSRPRTERSVLPANVCDSISSECRRTNSGLWRNAAGMCFTFIQRSARQRRNSISSADTCSLRTTAVVPV